ncbi:MAG: iron-siderophore ABC transporter substrate-binding protein [Rubrobacter sp.]|nr:iron-siderophore ABC transporter substrate-binding protein [Rubrobacter sp.]
MTKTIERARRFPALPEIDDVTRREFLIGAAGLLVLAPYGCGGSGGSEVDGPEDGRMAEHEFGETRVPEDPQRIVVTDGEITLDPMVALGVEPVAAPEPNYTGGIPEQISSRIEGDLTSIGTVSEPDFERVAELSPDLILGIAPIVEEGYDRLSQIAPTVGLDYEQTAWKEQLHRVASVIGREGEAERLLSDYEGRVSRLRETAADRLEGVTVTVARATDLGFRHLTREGSFPWTVLGELGLQAPREQEAGEVGEPFIEISQEDTPLLEADYIFLATDAGDSDESQVVEEVRSNALWRELEGEKIEVPSSRWVFGNVLTANAILDDVERYLVEESR